MRGRAIRIAIGIMAVCAACGPVPTARAGGITGGYRVVDLGPIGGPPAGFEQRIDDDGNIGPSRHPNSGAYSLGITYDPSVPNRVLENYLRKAGGDANLLPPSLRGGEVGYVGVNASGHVAGNMATAGGRVPFYAEPETGRYVPLGSLAAASEPPQVLGLNNLGQLVGQQGGSAIFYADPTAEPVELGRLLGSDTGWTFFEASGINNRGEIVGSGVSPTNAISYFKLEPVPEPSTLILFASLGLIAIRSTFTQNRRQHTAAMSAVE